MARHPFKQTAHPRQTRLMSSTPHGACCGHRPMIANQLEYLYKLGEGFMLVTDVPFTDVPCLEGAFCGEPYLEAAVLKRVEADVQAIQRNGKNPMKTIKVPVETDPNL